MICKKCGEDKPNCDFYYSTCGRYVTSCKQCARNRMKKWREDNAEYVKGEKLKYYDDITLEKYNELLQKQNNVYAICGGLDKDRRLAVDHNHETNEVRQLLCSVCNRVIGMIHEDINKLELIRDYLIKYSIIREKFDFQHD